MVVAVALWCVPKLHYHEDNLRMTLFRDHRSLELKPGQQESFIPPGDLRITNVALTDELADQKARTSIKLTYQGPILPHEHEDDEEHDEEEDEERETLTTILCSLTPGKVCHCLTYLRLPLILQYILD